MRISKHLAYLLCLTLYFNIESYFGQNIVPNYSFEVMESGHSNKPNDAGQLEFVENWENFSTSDVYGPNFNPFYGANNQLVEAKSGDKILGFGPCEGAQVELTQSIPQLTWVTVSFWYMPKNSMDTKINVYLTSDQVDESIALSDCYNPAIDYEVNYVAEVFGSDNNPPGKWHYFSKTILVEKSGYSWLAIKGDNIPGQLGHPNYVFVDDVQVDIFDFCSHLCVSKEKPKFNYITPDDEVTIGNSPNNFLALIEGANKVEMLIWNQYGTLSFKYNSYDPNGLSDPGFNDYAIVWNGHSTLTGNDFYSADEVYPFRITAESCNGNTIVHDGVINLVGILDPPAATYPETRNKDVVNCCEEYKFIQNLTYSSDKIESVNNFIIAGSNVTSAPYGDVVVQTGSTVEYRAEQSIILDSGFIVQQGASFLAKIEPCGASGKSKNYFSNEYVYYDSIRNRGKQRKKVKNQNTKVIPNPNDGSFRISSIPERTAKIIITDSRGIVVKNIVSPETEKKYYLNKISAGVYFATFINHKGGSNEMMKLIVQ